MDKIRFRGLLRRMILIPIGITVILALTLILEVQFLITRERSVEHSDQVIELAQGLYRARIDQETGLRAYLLTNDERFLQPFTEGRQQARKIERQLEQLISDDPGQQASNERAVQAFGEWSYWADEAVAIAKVGQDVRDSGFQLRGKDLMDKYRKARAEFFTTEERLRDERVEGSRKTLRYVNLSMVALCLFVGGILAALGRKQMMNLSEAFNNALDTAQANATEARAQKEWLRTTLTSIGDAVIATDADGAVTFMNPVAENLTEWTSPEATGKLLADVFRIVNDQTRETVENPIDKVRRLNQVVGLANHTVLISKTGKEFAIDDSGAPIRDADGKVTGIVLVFRDVTQQRNLESALHSNERLAVAGRLSASIAHEIHNPLDTVGNLLFLINQQIGNRPDLQQLISTAQSEVLRVTQISKNMLSLHRGSRAASRLKVTELLNGVIALVEETLAKGRRKFRVEHGFDGEIEGFPAELRQVFTNVIKNAVEATAEGGTIRVFSVSTEESGRMGVLVHVADNGVGVPEQMKSRLFNPFATTKEQESGSGLGLWVSRNIVERHGGNIRVISSSVSENPGTTVSIFLPLQATGSTTGDAASATVGSSG
jgi:PAS domain S-box-containing protein